MSRVHSPGLLLFAACTAPKPAQPLLAEGRYTLDRGGLIWEMAPLEGGSPDESCMADDVLAWEAMKPRTARARQAIAEIVGAEAE